MVKFETVTIPSEHDGLNLSVLLVLPEGEVRGLVQFAHGMAEHKGRYRRLMEFLAGHGLACIINDHRGHGESLRDRGDKGYFYKDGANGLVRDMHQLSRWFRNRFPGKKLVLVGHSMGSLAARVYAGRYGAELDGLVLSGSPGQNPAAKPGIVLSWIVGALHGSQKSHSRLFDRMVTGSFSDAYKDQSPFAWLSVNKKNVTDYENSDECGFSFTVNGYRNLLKLMAGAYDRKVSLRPQLPVHFMSGEDDPCAPDRKGFEGAVENMRVRGSKNVTAKMYPGLRHEIFNEGIQEIWDDLLAVIDGWIG